MEFLQALRRFGSAQQTGEIQPSRLLQVPTPPAAEFSFGTGGTRDHLWLACPSPTRALSKALNSIDSRCPHPDAVAQTTVLFLAPPQKSETRPTMLLLMEKEKESERTTE